MTGLIRATTAGQAGWTNLGMSRPPRRSTQIQWIPYGEEQRSRTPGRARMAKRREERRLSATPN